MGDPTGDGSYFGVGAGRITRAGHGNIINTCYTLMDKDFRNFTNTSTVAGTGTIRLRNDNIREQWFHKTIYFFIFVNKNLV